MATFDLRSALNAVSDVVNNRPRALREFDQIYMKSADMLLQAEHVSRHLDEKKVVFIGDGDAIGLCLMHLKHEGQLEQGPERIHILDFDQRVVNSVQRFARQKHLEGTVTAELYNVAEPLPKQHWQAWDGFYTNPPFGQRNRGASILAFLRRGFEALGGSDCKGCIAIADDPAKAWTQQTLLTVQKFAIERGYLITESLPAFHSYHLEDAPDLRSCSMIVRAVEPPVGPYRSQQMPKEERIDFYGQNKPLEVRYVIDHSVNGEDLLTNYSLQKYSFDQLDLQL